MRASRSSASRTIALVSLLRYHANMRRPPRLLMTLILIVVLPLGCAKDKPQQADKSSSSPTVEPPYRVVEDSTGTASLSGTVTYAGKEGSGDVQITKDLATCAAGLKNGKRSDGSVLVHAGAVQNAVVFLDDVKRGKPLPNQKATVNNIRCAFEPRVQVAFLGNELITASRDPVFHNTNVTAKRTNESRYNKAVSGHGKAVTLVRRLKRRDMGLLSINCDAHAWMQAWVYVFDHPYAVVTDAKGAFSLEQIPPGTYTLGVWHERLGRQSVQVTLKGNDTVTQDVTLK
jgi:hypothetical protein